MASSRADGGRPVRLYLLDDHEVVRRGVAGLVAADPDVVIVGQSGSARVAQREILTLRPDVVLFDVHLADGNGIDVCRAVRLVDPQIRGFVLTADRDPDTISAAIVAGAAGYVLKSIEGRSLIDGIKLVAGGHSLIDPGVASSVVQTMETQRRSLDVICELTPQQRRVFFLVAEGLTNREIAEQMHLTEKTVKNHVTGMLARLGAQHRTQAALIGARLKDAAAYEPALAAAGRGR